MAWDINSRYSRDREREYSRHRATTHSLVDIYNYLFDVITTFLDKAVAYMI